MYNKNIFQNALSETFTFLTHDFHAKTCPSHFKWLNLSSQMVGLHCKILVKKKMSVELCVRNYETLDGLVNDIDGIFENFIEIISKLLVWIHFDNPQIGHNTQIIFLQIYEKFLRLNKNGC